MPKMIGTSKIITQLGKYFGTQRAENLEVRIVRENNFQKAREFLHNHFCKQDPLHNCLKLHKHERSINAFEQYISKVFTSDMSVMMLNQRKDIIGLCLNRVVRENEEQDRIVDERFRKITDLVDAVDQKCNLFEKFGVEEYLKLEILTIDPLADRSGVDRKLVDVTRYLAQQNDLKLMRMDCANHYNAEAASKLGFTSIFSVKYENYRMGEMPVFKPKAPHKEYKVFVLPIEEDASKPRDKHPGKPAPPKPIKEYL